MRTRPISRSDDSPDPIRVLFLPNVPAPYRIPLFRRLTCEPGLEVDIKFLSQRHKCRNWEIDETGYRHEFLPGITMDIGSFQISLNPAILRIIRNGRYDVIIVNGVFDPTNVISLIVGKLRRAKLIAYSEGTEAGRSSVGRVLRWWERMWVRSVDRVILPGSMSSENYISQGVHPDRITIAPNAVDNNLFVRLWQEHAPNREGLRRKWGMNGITLLFVGQLIHRKGVDVLLRAFAEAKKKCPDLNLVIAGDGPDRKALEYHCASGLEGVTFTGWVDDASKAELYAAADIFVLPTRSDVWGLVLNEAMCFALPLISTRQAGGAADLVTDGINGYIVDAEEVGQLRNAILRMTSRRGDLRAMGIESYRVVMEYHSIDAEFAGFCSAIRAVTERDDQLSRRGDWS